MRKSPCMYFSFCCMSNGVVLKGCCRPTILSTLTVWLAEQTVHIRTSPFVDIVIMWTKWRKILAYQCVFVYHSFLSTPLINSKPQPTFLNYFAWQTVSVTYWRNMSIWLHYHHHLFVSCTIITDCLHTFIMWKYCCNEFTGMFSHMRSSI